MNQTHFPTFVKTELVIISEKISFVMCLDKIMHDHDDTRGESFMRNGVNMRKERRFAEYSGVKVSKNRERIKTPIKREK